MILDMSLPKLSGLDVLGGQLAAAAQESLQPESISLWLKKQEDKK